MTLSPGPRLQETAGREPAEAVPQSPHGEPGLVSAPAGPPIPRRVSLNLCSEAEPPGPARGLSSFQRDRWTPGHEGPQNKQEWESYRDTSFFT